MIDDAFGMALVAVIVAALVVVAMVLQATGSQPSELIVHLLAPAAIAPGRRATIFSLP